MTSTPKQTTRKYTEKIEHSASGRRSPLSPTVISRDAEKEVLVNLNDRLAVYIDKVRCLDTENKSLKVRITKHEDTSHREVTHLKKSYDDELRNARLTIDRLSGEKAKYQIQSDKYKSDHDNLLRKFTVRDKEASDFEFRLQKLEKLVHERERDLHDVTKERNKLSDMLKKTEKQLAAALDQLEAETLARVNSENKVKSLKEEIEFLRNIHAKEMLEVKSRSVVEYSEIESKSMNAYESKLMESLNEMRQQHEDTLNTHKIETEDMMKRKYDALIKSVDHKDHTELRNVREELIVIKKELNSTANQNHALRKQNSDLEARVKILEVDLLNARDEHLAFLKRKENELQDLKDQLNNQLMEYKELLDVKITLDTELGAYRSLLQVEEERLHIQPSPMRSARPMSRARRGRKRARDGTSIRIDQNAKTDGSIEVATVECDGNFVEVCNTGIADQVMHGWTIHQMSGGAAEATYKFPSKYVLKAASTLKIWGSQSAEATHQPPAQLIWKQAALWARGDDVTVSLHNDKGVEVAHRSLTRVVEVDADEGADVKRDNCNVM